VKLPFEVVLARFRADPTLAAAADEAIPNRAPVSDAVPDGEPPRVEWRGVRAGYEGREILHGIDARLGRREVVAVLGPNGSGKTTLFRTAMRLLETTAG